MNLRILSGIILLATPLTTSLVDTAEAGSAEFGPCCAVNLIFGVSPGNCSLHQRVTACSPSPPADIETERPVLP